MKKFIMSLSVFYIVLFAWCSVTFDFDWAMLERFTDKISYLYASCWSDIKLLEESMTPENIQSMDQTCVASIKAIKKIRWRIEKIKWRIWENEIINQILAKVDEIINTLQNSKDKISNVYENGIKTDISSLIDKFNWDELVESLQNLSEDYNN